MVNCLKDTITVQLTFQRTQLQYGSLSRGCNYRMVNCPKDTITVLVFAKANFQTGWHTYKGGTWWTVKKRKSRGVQMHASPESFLTVRLNYVPTHNRCNVHALNLTDVVHACFWTLMPWPTICTSAWSFCQNKLLDKDPTPLLKCAHNINEPSPKRTLLKKKYIYNYVKVCGGGRRARK